MKRGSGSCRRAFGLDATRAAALVMIAACASSFAGGACSTSQDGLAFDEVGAADAAAVGGSGSGLAPGGGGAPAVQGGSDGMGGVTVPGGAGGVAVGGASAGGATAPGGMNAGGARAGGAAGMNVAGMNVAGMNVAGMNVAGMNVAGMNSTTYENPATPDRVACGNDACEGSEVCCLTVDGPRCVASGVLCPTFVTRACDDKTDCAGNMICCGSNHQDSLRSLCMRRDDCADADDTMVICANSTQCQGEQRTCCPRPFGQMTAGVCRSTCSR